MPRIPLNPAHKHTTAIQSGNGLQYILEPLLACSGEVSDPCRIQEHVMFAALTWNRPVSASLGISWNAGCANFWAEVRFRCQNRQTETRYINTVGTLGSKRKCISSHKLSVVVI